MTIYYGHDDKGGFMVVDSRSMEFHYSYPSSTHADNAKHDPVLVAKIMLGEMAMARRLVRGLSPETRAQRREIARDATKWLKFKL